MLTYHAMIYECVVCCVSVCCVHVVSHVTVAENVSVYGSTTGTFSTVADLFCVKLVMLHNVNH